MAAWDEYPQKGVRIMASESFLFEAGINAIGPLIAAIFGLLGVNFISRAYQERREANNLKHQLIDDMTKTASILYHQIGMYSRARYDLRAEAQHGCPSSPDDQELRELRKRLLDLYPESRAAAEVIEARLVSYFEDPRIAASWHAVRDCLTVRYHEVIGGSAERWDGIRRQNAMGWEGGFHSGLSDSDLSNRSKVYQAYECHLKNSAALVFASPIRPRRVSQKDRRHIDRVITRSKIDFSYKFEPSQPTT